MNRSGSQLSGLSIRREHELLRERGLRLGHDERGTLPTGEPPASRHHRFRVMAMPNGGAGGGKYWLWVAHAESKEEAVMIGRGLSKMLWSKWKHEPLASYRPNPSRGVQSDPSREVPVERLRERVVNAYRAIGRPLPTGVSDYSRDQLMVLLRQLINPGLRRPKASMDRPSSSGRGKKAKDGKKAKKGNKGRPARVGRVSKDGRKPIR